MFCYHSLSNSVKCFKQNDNEIVLKRHCRNPGQFRTHANVLTYLNQGPSHLQSNALPTELFRQMTAVNVFYHSLSNSVKCFKQNDNEIVLKSYCRNPGQFRTHANIPVI